MFAAMRSYTENINDLISNKGSSSFSAITPMGKQHEDDLEATAADFEMACFDPAEEPEPLEQWDEDGLEYIQRCILYPNGSPALSDVNQRW